jgi:hypothetical protein
LLHLLFGPVLELPVRRRLSGRLVCADRESRGQYLPEPGIVVRLDELELSIQSAMQARFRHRLTWHNDVRPPEECDLSAVPFAGARVVSSGDRAAWQVEVELTTPCDHAVFEVVPRGWMYLAPCDTRNASLHCVTCDRNPDSVDSMLAESREIARRIGSVNYIGGPLPSAAEFAWPDASAVALPCSRGIFRWDPVCGDGVGASVRSALLASAGLKAIRAGLNPALVRDHVVGRSAAAFASHIAACENFYSSFRFDSTWHRELTALVSAKAEMDQALSHREWRFELRNLELCPR